METQQPLWQQLALTECIHSSEAVIMAESQILWTMHRQQKALQKENLILSSKENCFTS